MRRRGKDGAEVESFSPGLQGVVVLFESLRSAPRLKGRKCVIKILGFRERSQVFREKARDFDKGGAISQGPRSR